MAAGVGKTYRMLRRAGGGRGGPRRRRSACSRRTGARRPRRRRRGWRSSRAGASSYRGASWRRWTCPRSFARAPELCLIDELAHTNAPGRRARQALRGHRGRARRGIDVFRTVNVQHLESLNDQVAELTGVRVRETVPDAELAEADEVVLVDLPPEELITRLREGKVYPAGRVPAALNGFFRVENLAGAARGGAAAGGRGGRGEAPGARPARRARGGCRVDAPSRSRSACSRSPSSTGAASASSAAPRARPSGSAPSSTCSCVARPGGAVRGSARALEALRRLAAMVGASCSSRRATRSPRASARVAARARHDLRAARPAGAAPRPRPLRASHWRCASSARCPGSTSGSSPTGRVAQPPGALTSRTATTCAAGSRAPAGRGRPPAAQCAGRAHSTGASSQRLDGSPARRRRAQDLGQGPAARGYRSSRSEARAWDLPAVVAARAP